MVWPGEGSAPPGLFSQDTHRWINNSPAFKIDIWTEFFTWSMAFDDDDDADDDLVNNFC